nr:uncharacterized mitochondrial protein AtMg00810-like [Tanacetum cinerariifolium]
MKTDKDPRAAGIAHGEGFAGEEWWRSWGLVESGRKWGRWVDGGWRENRSMNRGLNHEEEQGWCLVHCVPDGCKECLSVWHNRRRGVKQKDDGIFISQDKYVADILKKFDFTTVKTASTPMEPNKALIKDVEAKDVDVHLYKSMIGSLMYLTASRPDIMFALCACARFQVTANTLHLHAVKRIFRYLNGQPKLGLWYPRDSPFDLEDISDSDYAGASLDKKSTIGGCQFLGKRLISWQCKKQTIVANSITKVEYVAATSCCRQVKTVNEDVQLQALVDGKKVIVNEESIRRDLRLDDAEGTACLPNATIFEELARMRVKFLKYLRFVKVFINNQLGDMSHHKGIFLNPSLTKMVFANMKRVGTGFSRAITPLFETMMVQAPEEIAEIEKLKKRVKKLEGKKKTRTHGPKILYKVGLSARIISSDKEGLGDQEDASKQGMIAKIDADEDISLINETTQDQGRMNKEDLFGVNDLDGDEVVIDVSAGEKEEQSEKVVEKEVSTADPVTTAGEVVTTDDVEVSTALTNTTTTDDELTLAQTLIEIKDAKPKAFTTAATTVTAVSTSPKEKGIIMQEPSKTPSPKPIVSYQQPSQPKDKGKAKMVEPKRAVDSFKRPREELKSDKSKKQKLDENVQAEVADDDTVELKRWLEIVPEDDDDNFNKEGLEVLRSIVKERFKKTKPVDDIDNLLFQTLKTMFEHHVKDNIWKYQEGAVKVYNWKLFVSGAGIQGYYCLQQKLMLPSSRVTTADRVSTVGWIKTEMA